jgi:hypothetical protein
VLLLAALYLKKKQFWWLFFCTRIISSRRLHVSSGPGLRTPRICVLVPGTCVACAITSALQLTTHPDPDPAVRPAAPVAVWGKPRHHVSRRSSSARQSVQPFIVPAYSTYYPFFFYRHSFIADMRHNFVTKYKFVYINIYVLEFKATKVVSALHGGTY